MKTKPGFEMKDPFLIDYKQILQELLKEVNVGSGPVQLLMVEMIRSRWIRDKRASYPFEVAWVFDRDEQGVAKTLASLEQSGDLELTGLSGAKKDLARPYKPKTLRKTTKPLARAKIRTTKHTSKTGH